MTSIPFQRMTMPASLVLVALVIAACQSGDDTSPSPSEAVVSLAPASASASVAASADASDTASAGAGEETSVFDLEVGDCFTADSTQLETVLVVDCEAAHVFEVYEVSDVGGAEDPFPGETEVQQSATAACEAAFEPYVGTGYQDSIWYVTTIPPNEQTWEEGDREVVCLLHTQEATEVTGSAEGSGE